MKPFENYKIERVGDARLEERIRQAYARKVSLEEYIRELTSEGEGGVGETYEELYNADEDFYMLLELRELRERRGAKNDNSADLKGKIKKHILAIREDVKNAGLDTSYISMASFEQDRGGKYKDAAYITNDLNTKNPFLIHYDFTEEVEE